MKAKDLAKKLMENPEFEVDFMFSEGNGEWGVTIRTFKKVHIGDIGYSDNVICLDGEEE